MEEVGRQAPKADTAVPPSDLRLLPSLSLCLCASVVPTERRSNALGRLNKRLADADDSHGMQRRAQRP